MDLKGFSRVVLKRFYEPVLARALDRDLKVERVRFPFSLAIMSVRRKQYVVVLSCCVLAVTPLFTLCRTDSKLSKFYTMFTLDAETRRKKLPSSRTATRPGLSAMLERSSSHRSVRTVRSARSVRSTRSRSSGLSGPPPHDASPPQATVGVWRARPRTAERRPLSTIAATPHARLPSSSRQQGRRVAFENIPKLARRSQVPPGQRPRSARRAEQSQPSLSLATVAHLKIKGAKAQFHTPSAKVAVFAWSAHGGVGKSSFRRAELSGTVHRFAVHDCIATLVTSKGELYTWDVQGKFETANDESANVYSEDPLYEAVHSKRAEDEKIVHELGILSATSLMSRPTDRRSTSKAEGTEEASHGANAAVSRIGSQRNFFRAFQAVSALRVRTLPKCCSLVSSHSLC